MSERRTRREPSIRREREEEGPNRRTASLAGLAAALLLIVVALYLVQQLNHKSRVEDCLLAGRLNCDAAAAGK
jgi:hypothetical protein